MGLVLAIAMIAVWIKQGDPVYMIIAALFYIGAHIGSVANVIEGLKNDKKEQ